MGCIASGGPALDGGERRARVEVAPGAVGPLAFGAAHVARAAALEDLDRALLGAAALDVHRDHAAAARLDRVLDRGVLTVAPTAAGRGWNTEGLRRWLDERGARDVTFADRPGGDRLEQRRRTREPQRPFTGDFAGNLLYPMLLEFGFARGRYGREADDGLELIDCRIANAVRCVPPENKPTPAEIRTCNRFLAATIAGMPRLAAIVALGRIAHDAVALALNHRRARIPFTHGAVHRLARDPEKASKKSHPALDEHLMLFDSYHCSRYNTNTGVLTPEMFRSVFHSVRAHLDK